MSLNKLLNVETGRKLGLNIGCEDIVIENSLISNGTSVFANLDITNLTAENLTIENKMVTEVMEVTNSISSDFMTTNSTFSSYDLNVSNELRYKNVVISGNIGNNGDVLTSNGTNLWEMKEPLPPPDTYGYAITNVEVADVNLSPSGGLANYTNAISESDEKNVNTPVLPALYYNIEPNGVEVKEAGFYRVDIYVELEFNEPNYNLHMTVIKGGQRPLNNKEVVFPMRQNITEAFHYSEIVAFAPADVVSIGLARSGTGTAPTADIKSWKLSIYRVY